MNGTNRATGFLSAYVFSIALAATPLTAPAEGTGVAAPLVFASGFETGDLTHWRPSGNAPEVQTSIKREGRYGMRSVTDRYSGLKVVNRTEVVAKDVLPPLPKQDAWYAFSVYLPAGYAFDKQWETVAQFHDIPDAGEGYRNPILAFWTDNGIWSVSNLWDDKKITTKDADGKWVYGGKWRYELGAYETAKWTDWVVHVRWSYQNDGLLQIWKNGVLVVDQRDKPNCFNDDLMPYFKWGIYKGWSAVPSAVTRREVYHDSFRMAVGPNARYQDVAVGGGSTVSPSPPSALKIQ